MLKAKSGFGLAVLFFILSLSFSFGIGYKLGQHSVLRSVTVSTPPVPLSPAGHNSVSADRFPFRIAPPAEKPSMMWMAMGKNKYTLYLASFQKFSDAEKEKVRLESKGLRGIEITERRVATGRSASIPSSGPGSALWYRLSYGRFETKEDAVAYGRQLTERGLIQDFWPKERM